ncbi:CpsD/CapB family tyrosine-protein kinase [Oceanirhabdus sp. W0125-5]|uniref:CpsD/CapB family tyrosine-protein kinase n=1 Tax=Oceanirhabdus sp. W0125-5 TaxID=2999116 RepID=UPI0022F3076A|nr:CpsD/CapB family tyrosine-protein kinase [Oceanirhabdus sp. W0125-5]WBW98941.1 CpsD/CapB family tyrosine-protein kinase [Oceanirhabdus sp. W0125-5]
MLIVENNPKSIGAEAYRTLRTNIQFSSLDKEIKSILVTSAYPGEGKTTTISNLALAFAQADNKVIVVDGDLRKPTVHRAFEVTNINGVSDVLIGKVSIGEAIKEYSENLHVMTCGTVPPNPAEMVASQAMKKLVEELSLRYDYILIDSPPILPVTDAQVISTFVDGTILVAASSESEKQGIKKAHEQLMKVNGNIIGAVITKVKKKSGKAYSGYQIYYGSESEDMKM